MKAEPLNDLVFLRETGEAARRLGFELYAVGGCARDWLLGLASADIDFLCGADPRALVAEITLKLGGSFMNFSRFLTTRLFLADGRRLDFAVFRKESYPKPAALPLVLRAASAAEDLKRRDFACNALAVSLLPDSFGELLDPFGGAGDIKKGELRVLHERSFVDDPTRLYRAARFAGRFGWRLEAQTRRLAVEAVKESIPSLLSRERLRNELLKLLSEKDPLPALEILKELDALKFIHERFIFGSGILSASGLPARLSVIAGLMGAAGGDFIKSLKLTRAMVREITQKIR